MELSRQEILEIVAILNHEFWDNINNHKWHEKLIRKNGSRMNAISATYHLFLDLTLKELENSKIS